MRINLRRCREKNVIYPILIFLCMLLCCVIIKNRIKKSKNNIPNNEVLLTKPVIEKSKKVLVLPTLVMACNVQFLRRSIESLQNFRPDPKSFPIIVASKSANCYSKETHDLINFFHQQLTTTFLEIPKQTFGHNYKYALNYVFKTLKHKAVIVLEDNLDVSPDFFEYFLGTYPLLKKDPSIWCVSAWNDNGKKGVVEARKHHLLHRTDFFPGHGWMLLSETWGEIESILPGYFIDDLMRNPDVTQGRVCIRPEISRTYKFGVYESNNVKELPYRHFDNEQRLLNTEFVPFTRQNLDYLLMEQQHLWVNFVYSCPETTVEDIKTGKVNSTSKYVRISYSNATMFKRAAKTIGLMDDFMHGVPRTGLYGIVQCFINNRRVFLTPVRKRFKTYINKSFLL
ncbi:alpha-1,3-mannosyl-glycoprotein 2-beta-N-acetylglucosaminyltransferase-like [Cydia pomonella]|uniref:alpha-1,3-mannosyl-glycoprotein 2-beta-N-acetylglucosaminyltransferase-like n=1 Tax=Cydia pomonella TaxID=82600 RepID=UPI002ADE000F|nr:alpha-1,3-mannosyl-glycoprotein 2-beta-N-acetylglucosaminyltransferase-like [Cydia pomonella]